MTLPLLIPFHVALSYTGIKDVYCESQGAGRVWLAEQRCPRERDTPLSQ